MNVFRPNGDSSIGLDGVHGINTHVNHGIFKVVFVEIGRPGIVAQFKDKINAWCQGGFQHMLLVVNKFIDIKRLGTNCRMLGKGE